jgi:hypothetical protein
MTHAKFSIILGSLLGTAVLHVVLVACSSRAGGAPDAAVQDARAADAHATDTAPPCTSWQIAAYYAPGVITRTGSNDWPVGLTSPVQLPSGWEPITASIFGGTTSQDLSIAGALAMVRKCVQ